MQKLLNHKAVKLVIISLAVLGVLFTIRIMKMNSKVEKTVCGDKAPMIYVDSSLYVISEKNKYYEELNDDFEYLGVVKEATCDRPYKNFQANDEIVGSAIYKYKENIVVLIEGKYWLYRPCRSK